jgi:growth factor-regulated tyrosine kinase substrate
MMGLFTSQIESDIEKVTSEALVTGSEDIETSLEICDSIRSKSVQAKDVLGMIKRRLCHKNPSVHLHALHLLDFCAKNGGPGFLLELATPSFTQFLHEYVKSPQCHFQVREKCLEYIQGWAMGFSSKLELQSMVKLYETLKGEEFSFPPPPNISSDFFESRVPPEWGDSDVCMRCRISFSLTNRKHHCRQCGETYCKNCSSRTRPLPHLGISTPVRVCDGCYETLRPTPPSTPQRTLSSREDDLELAIRLSIQEQQRPPVHNVKQLQVSESASESEDQQLAAAIAASLKDAPISQKKEPTSVENRFGEEEKALVQKFCDMVQRIFSYDPSTGTAQAPISRELLSLYSRVYPYQARLQRDLEDAQTSLNKSSVLHGAFLHAANQYENSLNASLQPNVHLPTSQLPPQPSVYQHSQEHSRQYYYPVQPQPIEQTQQLHQPYTYAQPVPQQTQYQPPNPIPAQHSQPQPIHQQPPTEDDQPLIQF